MVEITTPSNEEIRKYNDGRENLENNVLHENTINKLFHELVPHNTDLRDIMMKCSVLNDFYSTNIFHITPVAEHIHSLNIDERLTAGDAQLVNDIAKVNMNGKERYLYSFATKYCSHHNSKAYPIYDDYIAKTLLYFQKKDNFYKAGFKLASLKDYPTYKSVLSEFMSFYKLKFDESENKLNELDRYLWQLGKASFPKQYQKKKKSTKTEKEK